MVLRTQAGLAKRVPGRAVEVRIAAIVDVIRSSSRCCESMQPLAAGDRRVLEIDRTAMENFAGNVLELRGAGGLRVLAASQRAVRSLPPAVGAALASCVDRIVAVPVPTIENLGGGSVRCMLAEVFLPRHAAAASPDER